MKNKYCFMQTVFFFIPTAHETSLCTLGQCMKCSTQQGTWEEPVSDMMAEVLSEW